MKETEMAWTQDFEKMTPSTDAINTIMQTLKPKRLRPMRHELAQLFLHQTVTIMNDTIEVPEKPILRHQRGLSAKRNTRTIPT